MADIIGVLGEASATTSTTTTVYTVPSGKAAKFKIMWKCTASGSSDGDIEIKVNGITVGKKINIPANELQWSNSTTLIHDPSVTVEPDGSTAALTCSPAPQEFYLSAADTLQYVITGTAFATMQMQAVGSEVDVT